jgi:hypothetical protein
MFGEVDATNEEDVKKPKKHKVSGKGKKATKKHGKKKHHAKKIATKKG